VIDATAALAVELELAPVPADQVVAGAPSTGSLALGRFGGREYGVWEMTPGAMLDVETEELFVVVAGQATVATVETVAFEGDRAEDDGRVIHLAAGSVGRLEAGDRTIWTVTETLRKVYLA
jgi:hypothetical protein